MFGLRKKEKVRNKYIWAFEEYDPESNTWRHTDGPPGKANYPFTTKRQVISHLASNELNAMDWELITS